MSNERSAFEKYDSGKKRIIADIADKFFDEGVQTHKLLIALMVQGLRSRRWSRILTYGTVLEKREYNLGEDEWYGIWESYKYLHNHCYSSYPISFDPLHWKGLVGYLIEGAKEINKLEKVIFRTVTPK